MGFVVHLELCTIGAEPEPKDRFTAVHIMDAFWQLVHQWTKLWGRLHGSGSGGLEDSPHTHTHVKAWLETVFR